MKRKMIADAKLRQDGVWFKCGDVFECTDTDADDLKSMGMAHEAEEPAKRQYRRRDMTAQ